MGPEKSGARRAMVPGCAGPQYCQEYRKTQMGWGSGTGCNRPPVRHPDHTHERERAHPCEMIIEG